MIRRLAQIVAMLTVVAAVVNAQCAISCSLLTMSAASTNSPLQATQGDDHACCPHHRQSQTSQTQQAPAGSCPQAGSHSNDARIEANRVPVSAPVLAAVVEPVHGLVPPARHTSIVSLRLIGSPGPNLPSLVTVLRV
jgi:hypothetical protein